MVWILCAFYRMQMLLVPSKILEKGWGEKGKESPPTDTKEHYWHARRISEEVNRVAEKTPWESKCLVRALTARKFLYARGIESTMYLGVGKDEDGKMVAHAWVRVGEGYVTGGDGTGYAVVAKFCR